MPLKIRSASILQKVSRIHLPFWKKPYWSNKKISASYWVFYLVKEIRASCCKLREGRTASAQKGRLYWRRPSVSPSPMACSWASCVVHTWASSQPSSPFPELADRAVCTALRLTFQAILTARPYLPAQFQQTQTDHHSPALDVGLALQPLAMGSANRSWPGPQMWAF